MFYGGFDFSGVEEKKAGYLVCVGQILAVLSNVLPDEDVVVFKEDVEQLIYAVQALLPHIRLKKTG